MSTTGTINGVNYNRIEVHGDNAIFLGEGDVVVYKSKIVNGHDNTGYTERFRLFSNINMGDFLPTVYPSFNELHNPITVPTGVTATTGPTGNTGLGWGYDISKKYGGRTINTIIGPSGTTGIQASVTYVYSVTGIDWVQEKVNPFIEGL